jgi:L-lactate dehydrogenase (cytochrome)
MKLTEVRKLLGFKLPPLDGQTRRLARCNEIEDLRRVARRRIPGPVFDYVDGGADEEITLRANRRAFLRWAFCPDSLVDVSGCDPAINLLGDEIPFPLVLAPTGYTRMMHTDGELAVGRSAARAGLPYALSTVASTSIERLATTGHDRLWFQLYVWKDRGMTRDLIDRAAAAGYRVLELSVDAHVSGNRLRDVRNGLTIPPSLNFSSLLKIGAHPGYWTRMLRSPALEFANAPPSVGSGVTIENMTSQFDPSVAWDQLDEVRAVWPGPLLVKGPLSPDDARRAVEAGADGVHLSNHGGRQLDRTLPPIEVCPEVRDAVGEEATVVLDSGIRHGADLAVAIARGADAGAVGRAYLYGLMAAGEPGVDRAIELISAQLLRTMQLLGVESVSALRERGPRLIRDFKPLSVT